MVLVDRVASIRHISQLARNKLRCNAKKLFYCSGEKVSDGQDLADDMLILVSKGEAFGGTKVTLSSAASPSPAVAVPGTEAAEERAAAAQALVQVESPVTVRITKGHGDQTFVFFWLDRQINKEFSNWFMAPFTLGGRDYNCSEQAYMALKAEAFGDSETLAAIMRATSPRAQKRLGREIRGFKPGRWKLLGREVMYQVNVAKFSQCTRLREALLRTGDAILAEASPADPIWGIGLKDIDPEALDPTSWKGTNFLGEALMAVRAALRSSETPGLQSEEESLFPPLDLEAGDLDITDGGL